MNRYTAPLTAIALFAGAAEAKAATIIYYADAAGFSEANAPLQTEDFSDASLAPGLSLTGSGVSIITGKLAHSVSPTSRLAANFAGGVYAFGFDYDLTRGGLGQGISLTVAFADGTTQRLDDLLPSRSKGFYGFQSSRQIASAAFSARNGTESYYLDNFSFGGTGSAVPEPATWAMMIAGFGLAGAGLRQRRRMAQLAWS